MFTLRLPATSANLGPGFDAMGLALDLWLELHAEPATHWSIHATGRNARQCEDIENSLIVRTYREVCAAHDGSGSPALALRIANGIPFGMGLGSSAAALLAGVALANEFCALGWSRDRVVAEAAAREGHADNVAACWYGGLTIVATEGPLWITRATVDPPVEWRPLVVMPDASLATSKARAVLATEVSRADAVFNLQRSALLTLAFLRGDDSLLREATRDRLHQPQRLQICPLLARLLPLADGDNGVLSVTLSGAGPSVLLLVNGHVGERLQDRVRELAGGPVELLQPCIATSVFTR